MYDYTCSHCRQRSLIFPSQVRAVINDEAGIVVVLTCWCGETGALRTGQAATARRIPNHAPAPTVRPATTATAAIQQGNSRASGSSAELVGAAVSTSSPR